MKKYRLKKYYPTYHGLLLEGSIAKEREDFYYVFNEDVIGMKLSKKEVENNPEFWEEVEEKEYEILNHRHGVIHSVRRKIDSEVFTVGDKVKHKNGATFEICNIRFWKGNLQITSGTGITASIKDIERWKPLFTTEDGVDIYEGDKDFYVVCISNEYSYVPYQVFRTSNYFDNKKEFIHFKSKEKAWEWIEENKPKFSKKDIEEAIGGSICFVSSRYTTIYNSGFWGALDDAR